MKVGQHPDLANLLTQASAAKQQGKAAASDQAKAAASAAPASQAASQTSAVAQGGVPVSFSREARGMEPAMRSSGGGDFDAAKVKAVREALANGTFSVDAEAIADKLLSNAQEVLSRRNH